MKIKIFSRYYNEATYFLTDHLGNTRVAYMPTTTTNHDVYIINAVDYYPYGKVLREYDNGAGDRYLTTQHERDRETGLDYRGARYYDSDVARFLSTDPWADKYQSWSTYNYVMGNPVTLIDPNGKGPTDWFFNTQTAMFSKKIDASKSSMLPFLLHGRSKGIAYSKKKKTVIYWVIFW